MSSASHALNTCAYYEDPTNGGPPNSAAVGVSLCDAGSSYPLSQTACQNACGGSAGMGSTATTGLRIPIPGNGVTPIPSLGDLTQNAYGVPYDPLQRCREYQVIYDSGSYGAHYSGGEQNILRGCFLNLTRAQVLNTSTYQDPNYKTSIGTPRTVTGPGTPCAASTHYCKDGYVARDAECVSAASFSDTLCSSTGLTWPTIATPQNATTTYTDNDSGLP